MSQRLTIQRPSGMDRNALWLWGVLIVAAGIAGRSILQNRMLGMGSISTNELLAQMETSAAAMNAATVALVLQAVEGMAVPIFAVLTVDGVLHTASMKNYLLRMAAAALLSEIPYNLAMRGTLLDTASRNPMFGLVLVLVMLYLFRSFAGKDFKSILIKVVVFLAAWLWASMFAVAYGRSMVVIACVLWVFWERRSLAMLFGIVTALICSAGNLLFMFAPFGFLISWFYNGEAEEAGHGRRVLRYLLYPIVLLLAAAAGRLLF